VGGGELGVKEIFSNACGREKVSTYETGTFAESDLPPVIVFCTTMADNARAPVYLPTYKLGDEGQPNHLNASISREAAAIKAKALIVGDAAFIKRSDLKWTYAILTERIEGEPVVLRFEVDKERNRKSFPEAQWGKYVRVIHVDEAELARLKVEAGEMVAPDEEKVESVGDESKLSFKTGKTFFSIMTRPPKKEAKKEIATESKPDEAIKEVAPTEDIKSEVVEIKKDLSLEAISEQPTNSTECPSVGGKSLKSTSSKRSIRFLKGLATNQRTKKDEDTKTKITKIEEEVKPESTPAQKQHETVVATSETVAAISASPETITSPEEPEFPEARMDEVDNTKENSSPEKEEPRDDAPSRSVFSPLVIARSNDSSVRSKLSKLGSKIMNGMTPPVLKETEELSEPPCHNTTSTKSCDLNWVDTEAWEVDYDKAPTDLFQALEARQFCYVESMYDQQNVQFNKECKTWVVARGQKKDQLRFRALPLHAALVFGAPDDLVTKIFTSYPLAARGRDVKGRLPIHLAMEHNASDLIVNLIIEAFPKGIFVIDKKSKTPLDYIKDDMARGQLKKNTLLIVSAKVEEERAKWELEKAESLAKQRLALTSDTEFIKPIIEKVTQKLEYDCTIKLSLVEENYKREMEAMKKLYESETKALLDGFEAKLTYERKMKYIKGSAQ